VAVARRALEEGEARAKLGNVVQAVQDTMWQPVYPEVS
jgi:malate dehydrogenase (oxaloacetate-decarboxylating)